MTAGGSWGSTWARGLAAWGGSAPPSTEGSSGWLASCWSTVLARNPKLTIQEPKPGLATELKEASDAFTSHGSQKANKKRTSLKYLEIIHYVTAQRLSILFKGVFWFLFYRYNLCHWRTMACGTRPGTNPISSYHTPGKSSPDFQIQSMSWAFHFPCLASVSQCNLAQTHDLGTCQRLFRRHCLTGQSPPGKTLLAKWLPYGGLKQNIIWAQVNINQHQWMP